MFYVDNSSGVPVMPAPSPVTSEADLFFTEGGNGTPPTYPGPDWFNTFQTELINIVRAAGLDLDKLDNTQLLTALGLLTLSRSNPFGDIAADGPDAIATALANLQLGEAAKRGVGNAAGQIPDMSFFLTNAASLPIGLYLYLPNGLILQFGNISAASGDVTTTFPVAFPNACLKVLASQAYTPGSNSVGYVAAVPISKTQMVSRGSSTQLGGVYAAIGI